MRVFLSLAAASDAKHTQPLSVNVNRQIIGGNTPLHLHALNGQAEQCQLLIEAKADVNATNKEGYTPLLVAVRWGKPAAVSVLLAARCDVNIKRPNGETALSVAALSAAYASGTAECKELIRKSIG